MRGQPGNDIVVTLAKLTTKRIVYLDLFASTSVHEQTCRDFRWSSKLDQANSNDPPI